MVGGLIIVVLVTAIWLILPHESSLIESAHAVIRLRTLPRHTGGEPVEQSCWLSSHQLLIITTDTDERNESDTWNGHLELFDTTTHTRSSLAGLTKKFARSRLPTPPRDFKLSPGGTWLHWHVLLGGVDYLSGVVKWDGTQDREWRSEEDEPTFWMDDQHFVAVLKDGHMQISKVTVHDARTAKGDRSYPLGSIEAKSILKDYGPGGTTPNIHAFDSMPTNSKMEGMAISPQRKAMLVQFAAERTPPILAWIHRYVRAIPAKPKSTEELWIVRIDDGSVHEVGHIAGSSEPQLQNLEFLPDGNQISFVYHGMLYVTPIETSK